jgi:hypothetical protein
MGMNRALLTVAVLLTTAIPSYAVAQVESTPIPASAKPDFSPMSFLLGSWSCSTKSSRRPAAFATAVTYAMDATGYWLDQTSTVRPISWMTRGLTTWDKITYDADTKRWVDVSYDNAGGYGLSVSSGWNGDKIVWHDVSFAPGAQIATQSNQTTMKLSSTRYQSASSFTEAKTGRRVDIATVCTKRG